MTEAYIWLLRSCKPESVGEVKQLRGLFTASDQMADVSQVIKRYTELRHANNILIRDSLMLGGNLRTSYHLMLKRLTGLGSLTSFLYVLDDPVHHAYGEPFPRDLDWNFKSYCYGSNTFAVPDAEQRMKLPQVFSNEHLNKDRRHTLIAADLFNSEY